MSTQQPPRPWFRLATIMRPAAPPPAPAPARPPAPIPAPQPPPPISPFRPPVAGARPPQPAPSPVAPAQLNMPVASPTSATPTTPKSPEITRASPPAASSTRSPPPSSPATPAASITRSPVATPAPQPLSPPSAIAKPESPVIKSSYLSPPPSPAQKALADTSATRPVVSSSLPQSPKTKVSAPSSPLPNSPVPKTLPNSAPIITNSITAHSSSPVPPPPSPVPTSAAVAPVRAPASNSSPKPSREMIKPWEKTPPPRESPITKTLSHPPSPLTLPPPQLKAEGTHDNLEPIPAEAEQKTVLMQDANHEKPKMTPVAHLHHNNHGEIHTTNRAVIQNGEEREPRKDKGVIYKKNSNHSSPEFGIRIVTLSGENKGAIMELSPAAAAAASRKKHDITGLNLQEKLGGSSRSRVWVNGKKLGSKNDDDDDDEEEGKYKMKDEEIQATTMQANARPPMDAFVNSNVQGVNNSILYNCNYKNRDPGVHLSVSRKGNGGLHLQDSTGNL